MKASTHRVLRGIVTSTAMQKTAVVRVNLLRRHPKYLKYFKMTTRLKAHDEKNEYRAGDRVIIQETKPLSKEKRWIVISKIN